MKKIAICLTVVAAVILAAVTVRREPERNRDLWIQAIYVGQPISDVRQELSARGVPFKEAREIYWQHDILYVRPIDGLGFIMGASDHMIVCDKGKVISLYLVKDDMKYEIHLAVSKHSQESKTEGRAAH